MATTYTQTDLDNLNEALMTGASEIQIGEKKIVFRSVAELRSLIRQVERQLSGASSSTTSPNVVQATFSKGESE